MMHPFTKHTGLVAPLDRVNIDTDQMIPKQFCKLLTREGYGRVLFYDWRYLEGEKPNPDFVLNQPKYKGASILLTRANVGCGSSREHAAWGVFDYGFRAVIAPSFADIFFNNCFKNGVLPVSLTEAEVQKLFEMAEKGDVRLTVDLAEQIVTDGARLAFRFAIDPFRKEALMKGLDEIGMTLQYADKIAEFERDYQPGAPMFEAVDVKYAEVAK
jgi:3-isopropylmalate/(R)-2-methylmalate dehydratase small subunit